ncbi:hypothetical protein JOC27_000653 [Sporolactobacillus spathodeae]|uniref:Uncharacterized protein n=1 Tax=Sporolactobacillus spathodeae TaxID=1465502 RepID=A0ABS2Q5Z6_9BACL|nr:hypothetical protein [Sporolactobacillus spathodeae]
MRSNQRSEASSKSEKCQSKPIMGEWDLLVPLIRIQSYNAER